MKGLMLVVLILFACGSVQAGQWTSYDYGTGDFTTGSDITMPGCAGGSTTSGTAYDYGTGTFTSYSVSTDGMGHSHGTSYDYGTGTFKTFDYNR